MAKAVAVINRVRAEASGQLVVSYSVAIDDGKNFDAEAPVNLSQTLAQFFTAARADSLGIPSTRLLT